MNYAEIQAFLAVVRCGSLSAAAAQLFLSQPSVSGRIASLEAELNARLLARGKGIRTTELTEAGLAFVPVAEKWEKLWSESLQAVGAQAKQPLRGVVVHSVNTYLIPEAYRAYAAGHDRPLSLCTFHSQEAYHQVESGDAEFALIASPMYSQRVKTIPLFREDMYFVCAPEGPFHACASPGELRPEQEIMLEWSREFIAWHRFWFGGNPRPRLFTDDMQILELQAARRDCWLLAPASCAMSLRDRMGLFAARLRESPEPRTVYLLRDLHTGLTEPARDFVRQVLACARQVESVVLAGGLEGEGL